jgi:hypothetical protein
LYKFIQCWSFVTHIAATGGLFDDTLAYPKRFDRYNFRGYRLVATIGGDGLLNLPFPIRIVVF